MENKDLYPKSSDELLSEIRSIMRLQRSLSKIILLKDSDAGFELQINGHLIRKKQKCDSIYLKLRYKFRPTGENIMIYIHGSFS